MPRPKKSADTVRPDEARGNGAEAADLESLVASHYLANEDLNYDQIRQMMGLSRATVARRLQHARESGWLVDQPMLRVPPNYQQKFDALIYETELQKKLCDALQRYGLRSITIVSDKDVGAPNDHQIARRLGQAAAARIRRALVNRGGTIGINWGYSMRWVVEHLSSSEGDNRFLRFVPLMGDLSVNADNTQAYDEAQLCSANRLARRCAEAFSARVPRTLTTPAIISRAFMRDEHKRNIIWEFIGQDLSYINVFGPGHHTNKTNASGALVTDMDTIISGMSSLSVESALVSIANLAKPEDVATLTEAGFVGDLGGHPIYDPESGDPGPEAKELAEAISALVISATPRDFKRIAGAARQGNIKNPEDKGVFIVGIGKQKARAFLAAIKMEAVNELFTDRATAEEMARVLGLE